MPFIRRTLKAAFWGVPGPAVVGSLMASAIYGAAYLHLKLNPGGKNLRPEILALAAVPLAEAGLGVVYGLMRACVTSFDGKWRNLNLIHGAMIGTCVWCVVGSPFLAIGALVAVLSSLDGHLDLSALAVGMCLGHVACGAIAGFHVEYYLLHGREPE